MGIVQEPTAKQGKHGLFAQCSFAIVRSATLTDDDAEQLAEELRLHEAEVVLDQYPDDRLDLRTITHVVSATYDFPDYVVCADALLPVVKPTWIQHSLARDKLANPRQYTPDPRHFLSDVVVCVADLPQGDTEAIIGGVLAMGGLYSVKLTSQTTHVISLTTDSEICASAEKKLAVKVVLPHWVDDCLKLGRKIDEDPYLLPDPEILQPPPTKAPMGKRKTAVRGATDPDPSQINPERAAPRELVKVFKNRTLLLAADLGISTYLRGVLVGMITAGGGKITESVSQADMYICKYREGRDYQVASRAGKDVGNLAWLYYLIQTDEWTSPLRRMLHYPIPKGGLTGFHGLRISLSNYSGDARTYLEYLIQATGAECTKTLKPDNTHLITAFAQSEKVSAAQEWGMHIVNHLWLEESYAKWKMQSVSGDRYTHFPQRTNLGDIVGSTQLDRQVLEQHFYRDVDDDATDGTAARPTRHAKGNRAEKSGAHKKPVAAESARISVEIADKSRPPAGSKVTALGKEIVTPPSTHGRKSKEMATLRLHEMTPDILLYEKERKRVGGVVYGGRRKSDADQTPMTRKRSHGGSMSDDDDDMATDINEAKRRKSVSHAPTMHLVVSGYTRWVGQSKTEDMDKKQLRRLGIICTTDPRRATHVAIPRIFRTQKFVTALAYAPLVVSTDYIDACLEKDEFLDPEDFRLVDRENEQKLGFTLKVSRDRAAKNRNQLLRGRTIFCLENLPGGFDTFRTIVEANGGKCMLWRSRKGQIMPSGRADSNGAGEVDGTNEVYLLADAAGADAGLCQRFRAMAEGSRKIPRVVTTDWVLESAMAQQVLPIQRYEVR